VALTFLGSDRLVWFDAALVGYLYGLIFFVFGVIYRYKVWVRRPPTAILNRRGWDAFRQRKVRNAAALPSLVATQLLAQGFIRRRSKARWMAHQLVFWGCILAAAITFPLTLGLLHFESVGQSAEHYRIYISKVGTVTFGAESIIGWITFHGLDIAAVLVLAGVFIFLRRRLRDPGAMAVERSGDFLALAGLFAVSMTGLFLTVSSVWLEGRFYSALNTVHALTVILGLMYIPFGKLFHIFQRPANLGVAYYKRANAEGPAALCRSCGTAFASAQQMADLMEVLPQVGFNYELDNSGPVNRGVGMLPVAADNYQLTCPSCRRRQVALAQCARVGGFG
ncbi:MAG: MFS transporter, partial [Ilumatobacteraceae bacterium]